MNLKKTKFSSNNNKYFEQTRKIINELKDEIENNKILYSDLNNCLQQEKKIFLEKMMILEIEEKEKKYEELCSKIEKINEIINKLDYIYENLSRYHKNVNKANIEKITTIISEIKKGDINQIIKNEKIINNELSLEFKCKKIEKVKNYNIFNILYNSSANTDDDSHFNETYKQLEDLKIIFNVPEELNISLSKIIQKVQTNGVIEELIEFLKLIRKNINHLLKN